MDLHDLSGVEPLLPLFAFHRRAEKQLAQLAALASELPTRPIGADLCAAASAALRTLGEERAAHHALEESRLLPAIGRRINDARAIEELRRMRCWIGEDHQRIAIAWREVSRPLKAISEGIARRIDIEAVAQLRTVYGHHIVDEEMALHRFALRYLSPRIAA